jgi:Homeodomain-like domain
MGYRGKLAERQQARQLRRTGLPLAEIAARLGVSRSSVSLWVRDVEFPVPIRSPPRGRRRGPNALQRRRQAEIDRLVEEGRVRIGRLTEREFLVAGVAQYAGEGTKRDGAVRFANSDPRMILFFCCWLRRFFEIDESRLRVRLYLHEGLDLAATIAYWSALTGIPPSRFGKPYRAVPDPSIRHAKHVHGCVTVSYSCSPTHRSIMGLVSALQRGTALPG